MNLKRAFLACFCLLGATHLAFSQAQVPAARPIPGYLNPTTGKFTTRAAAAKAINPQDTTATTSVFFREDFQIYIANYDQKGTSAVCEVDMYSDGDANSEYEEEASVPATAVGSGFSCDVPVLTLWALSSPSTDTISASVTVYIYTPSTQSSSIYLYPAGYRSSTQTLSVAQPANGQTAVNSVKFSL